MVFEPLGEPLWMLKNRFRGAVLPPDVLRTIIRMVISGLHYLHTQASIIHTGRFLWSCNCFVLTQLITDLKSDNILMALRDQSVLDTVAREELQDPLPQKNCDDRTIYLSRNDFGFQPDNIGRPVLMDFGLSACGKTIHNHPIQPQGFRAPEVIIGSGWDYSVDIWNLGALVMLIEFSCYHSELTFRPDVGTAMWYGSFRLCHLI